MTAAPDYAATAPGAVPPGAASRWTDIDGPVHYLDYGGPAAGPVIVCVHGLSGSALNWMALAPLLTGEFRVLAPDLAGHGITRSAGRRADVSANQLLLHRFIQAAAGGPAILVGNSMGGMISLLEAGAVDGLAAGLILIDPALPFVPSRPDPVVAGLFALQASPVIGRALSAGRRRMPPQAAVAGVLALCCADPSRVPREVVEHHVELARQRAAFGEAGRDLGVAMRSVIRTAGFVWGQEYRRRIRNVTCPVLLLHGERDRLVPASAARGAAAAHPSWSVRILPDVGHVPQLEAPGQCAEQITSWLKAEGLQAASGAQARRARGKAPRRERMGG
jgi:pimeloyl-ACP methyl ester carboxylesterase